MAEMLLKALIYYLMATRPAEILERIMIFEIDDVFIHIVAHKQGHLFKTM